jgi:hypothetical protein
MPTKGNFVTNVDRREECNSIYFSAKAISDGRLVIGQHRASRTEGKIKTLSRI